MDIYKRNCANGLKKIRKDFNLTQEELAKILNTTKQSISSYEKGKMLSPTNVLIEISKYFNMSIDTFIFDNENSSLKSNLIYTIKKELNDILNKKDYIDTIFYELKIKLII